MKKKLLFILTFITALTLTLVFAGCKKHENETTPQLDPSLEFFSYAVNGEEIIIFDFKDYRLLDGLTEFVIPACVTEIGDGAFDLYGSFAKKIIFEENSKLKKIGNEAFNRCYNLTDIEIPASVTSIGNNAFSNCWNLTEFTIPDTVVQLGENVFDGSFALTLYCEAEQKPVEWSDNFNSPNVPTVWDCKNNEVANDGRIYKTIDGVRYSLADGQAHVVRQPEKIQMASICTDVNYNGTTYQVTKICDKAFYECQNLTYATIPTSVKTIGKDVYWYCFNLLEVTYLGSIDEWVSTIEFEGPVLQNGVGLRIDGEVVIEPKITTATKISANAFSDYQRMISLEIPKSVTVIEENAFTGCYRLVLFCEAIEKPQGWCQNIDAKTIVWNSNNNDIALDGNIYTKVNGLNYQILEGEARLWCQNENLTSLTIPAQITYKNQKLNVVGSANVPIFSYLLNLRNVFYEGTLKDWFSVDIQEAPFYYVDNFYINGELITEVVVPPNAKPFGTFEFYKKLTRIVFSEGLTSAWGLYGCENLTEVVLPSTLTYISNDAFSGCSSLEEVIIPASVKTIDFGAFEDCTALKSVVIEENNRLSHIGNRAFNRCFNLTSITIPQTVTNMGADVFTACNNLVIYCEISKQEYSNLLDGKNQGKWYETWNFSERPVVWNSKNNDVANDGYIYTIINDCTYRILGEEATFIRPNSRVENLVIPEKITYKGKEYLVTSVLGVAASWEDKEFVISVVIPDSVTYIAGFNSCSNLTSVTISTNSKLEKIPKSCFYGCEKLETIFIPKSVIHIERDAFEACTALTIYCEVESMPSTWSSIWAYVDGLNECPIVWGYKG